MTHHTIRLILATTEPVDPAPYPPGTMLAIWSGVISGCLATHAGLWYGAQWALLAS